MSYDEGDVSMASFRDESFNMSVDHDTIDVVWHSTQQPTIQSILEESKLHQRQKSPLVWDPNDTPSIAGCFPTAPKSLFKGASTARAMSLRGPQPAPEHLKTNVRSRPGMGRVTSSPDFPASFAASSAGSLGTIPIDPRKIRPSQRRLLIQGDMTPAMQQHERVSQAPVANSIENLDNLREMIKSVGRTWGKGDSSPISSVDSKGTSPEDRPPSRTRLARTSVASNSASHSTMSSSRGGLEASQGRERMKPKLATTIKVPKAPSDLYRAISSRTGDPKGLMLPPALPSHRQHSIGAGAMQFPSKSSTEDDDMPLTVGTSMQLDDDDLFPTSSINHVYTTDPLSPSQKKLTPASQPARETSARSETPPQIRCTPNPPEKPSIQHIPERNMNSTHNPSLSQQPQSKKTLGMRRTASGNRFEPNTFTPTSSQQPPLSRPLKRPLTTGVQGSPLLESPETPTQEPLHIPIIPLPPQVMRISPELASRPKSFKVPWANNNTSPVEQRSSSSQAPPSNSQSSGGTISPATTSTSSLSSPHNVFGGANVAKAMATVTNRGDTVMLDYGTTENADSSYSFDDIDAEELDRVLSQCGA